MKTSVGIFVTALWLLLATRPIATLSQGALESYWFARMNRLSMDLTKRLLIYLALVLVALAVAIGTTWLVISWMPGLQ